MAFKMKGSAFYGKGNQSPIKHAGNDDYAHHQKISDEKTKWHRYLGPEIKHWWADRPWGPDPGGTKRLHKKYEITKSKNTDKSNVEENKKKNYETEKDSLIDITPISE